MISVRNIVAVAGTTFGLWATSAFAQSDAVDAVAELSVKVPSAVASSYLLGHADPAQTLHLAVSLPFADPSGMQAYVDSVSDPRNPNYHNWLTPAEVGARFGVDQSQLDSVVNYLRQYGMHVNLVGDNRLSILVDATVAQTEAAFGTTINRYWNGKQFAEQSVDFANATTLHAPQSIAALIQNVSGVESFTKPKARALTATQARSLYSLTNSYTGGNKGLGRAVAISNWDGYRLSNVPLYYTQMGLPAPAGGVGSNIHVVTISGGAGAGTPQGEGDLDIQMVLGMAPLCDLYVYDGGSNDLIGVLTKEANDNIVDIASESWGWGLSAAGATAAHNLHLSMSAQGITYMAASGDSGTMIEPYSYPNYDTEVLMVGGTVATIDILGTRTSEVGWSGSGGGWSTNTATFNKLPSYQKGTGVPTTINYRLSPDVALHASGAGAYQFYLNGSLSSAYVGTSFACPVFAGGLATSEAQIIALGGLAANASGKRRFGRIQDLIYGQNGRSDVWRDITSGSNGKLPNNTTSSATAGWDFVTGWGAINFDAFVNTQVSGSQNSAPAAPSSLTATAGNAQVSLTWSATTGATSYNILRGAAAAGPFTSVGTSTTASFTNTGLTNGTTYYYVVTATNSKGTSGNSPVASAKPVGPTDYAVNGGFETSGGAGWGYSAGVINANMTAQPAHGGTHDAWLGGHGKVATDFVYQVLTLPATLTSANLTFWLHIDSAETVSTANDTCQVQIRDANNKVLTTLATYSNANKAAGYSQKSFSLAAYKGQKIMIYVTSTENASKQTSFVFDDFSLIVQ